MPSIEAIIAGTLLVSLTIYALSGGADFGGGVWELFAYGPRKKQQEELIERAIAPIWEANHVWLILVVVILFFAFPPAFALITTALNVPITIMLIGIVLRGSAFIFRSSDQRVGQFQARWGRLFAMASTVTPIMLGIIVGAISSGSVGKDLSQDPSWYFTTWCSLFPFSVGLFTLSLFALLAASYLLVETNDKFLENDFRLRALWAALFSGIFAFTTLFLIESEVPTLRVGLLHGWWSLGFHLSASLIALSTIRSLWRRRYRLARILIIVQVILVIWGWAFSQYPLLVPPLMTFSRAAAPANILWLLLYVLLAGMVVLVPSMWYLYWIFKRRALDLRT